MTDEEFVDLSVRHQLGNVASRNLRQDQQAHDFAFQNASGSALSWAHHEARPRALNGWVRTDHGDRGLPQFARPQLGKHVDLTKYVQPLHEAILAGWDLDLIIDMQDRRVRELRLPDGGLFPTLSFNRLKDESDRILWPLPLYHDIAGEAFLGGIDPNAVPWSEKRNLIVWRGIPGGRASPKVDMRKETLRLPVMLTRHASGTLPTSEAAALISTFPRHRFVERMFGDQRADVGFISRQGVILDREPLLAAFERPRTSRTQMQHFKYLAVLRGNDLGSSFFWTMNSGSLGLVMETPFDSFASCHFRPWEHYVPFREDMSDFDANFAWCQAHQEECREMTMRAAATCRLLARADLRTRVFQAIVTQLRDSLRL